MRIFISTGEVSGDLQGALLVAALQRQAAARGIELEIVALGGDRMAQKGATLLDNTTHIGSVGLLESVRFVLPTWLLQRQAKRYLQANPPDVLVLIDYPGPNGAISSYLRKQLPHVPIVYYIAPQDWAVPQLGNTKHLARTIDLLLAIFPQSARYYRSHGIKVSWVGHPLVERMQSAPSRESARAKLGIKPDQIAIALLPASRRQEIEYLLPVICQAAQQIQSQLPGVHFWLPLSLPTYREAILAAIQKYQLRATVLEDNTLEAIAAADLAITKSGTVNLEIALLNVPQVVLYRVSAVTAWIARRVLRLSIPFMSPPNLVLMKPIVPELLQEKATPARIAQESLELLVNKDKKNQVLAGYAQMRQYLGKKGACDRAAQEIINIASRGSKEVS